MKDNGENLVWARVARFAPWPGLIVHDEEIKTLKTKTIRNEKEDQEAKLIHFLGTYEYFWVLPKHVITYSDGIDKKLHRKSKGKLFMQSIQEADNYLNHGKYPEHFFDQSDDESEDESQQDSNNMENEEENVGNQKLDNNSVNDVENNGGNTTSSPSKSKMGDKQTASTKRKVGKGNKTPAKKPNNNISDVKPVLSKKEEGRLRCLKVMQQLGLAPL
ncbi:Histone-lysine N-methyltransferase ATX1 [Trichoplax sp. H2]|nr:Histone-lysine N-methyltransferase ATX1 [Trichoplax sp. H2]|eukprot:RDD36557.1 Histone-lysine N-methyltransferase ATX1 [Trichoplax sp. H2]